MLRFALCVLEHEFFFRAFKLELLRCILSLLDRVLCRHLLNPFDWCSLILMFLHWFFCLDYLFIGDTGLLKSPHTIVLGPMGPLMSSDACFLKLGTPMSVIYISITVISSWGLFPLTICVGLHLSWLLSLSIRACLCLRYFFRTAKNWVSLFNPIYQSVF